MPPPAAAAAAPRLLLLTCAAAVATGVAGVATSLPAAGSLPPQINVSFEWLDPFVVRASWTMPGGLPEHCTYKTSFHEEGQEQNLKTTPWGNISETCLINATASASWTFTVSIANNNTACGGNQIAPVTARIQPQTPRAQLVEDFRCFVFPNRMSCSWIPVDRSLNVTLSYRVCGEPEIGRLRTCDSPQPQGERHGCILEDINFSQDICMLVSSAAGQSSFRPLQELTPPTLRVTGDGDNLNLTWNRPEVAPLRSMEYKLCYTRCNQPKTCKSFQTKEQAYAMAYDKRCRYELWLRVDKSDFFDFSSSFSQVVVFGANESPDQMLTVVAVVISIILPICVFLSCYCFRRHSAIICPIIPDPSAIFKEMMMNGSHEAPVNLYTPVPEPVESCKISLMPENS